MKKVRTVQIEYMIGSWRHIGIYNVSVPHDVLLLTTMDIDTEHKMMKSVYNGKLMLRMIYELLEIDEWRVATFESVIVEVFLRKYLRGKGIDAKNIMWGEGFRPTMREKIKLYIEEENECE